MIKRVYCSFVNSDHYARPEFRECFERHGYQWVDNIADPTEHDIALIWNRNAQNEIVARRYEAVNARVIVVENGYLGKHWRGQQWYAMATGHHNGGGWWHSGGPERWDSWAVELLPWRKLGGTELILAQRGIGEPGIAEPGGWSERLHLETGIRVRMHPGKTEGPISLEQDLEGVSTVLTWASGAAIKAIIMGVPVYHGFEDWIGADAATWIYKPQGQRNTDDHARLRMLHHLAWAQWSREEVKSGLPLDYLL